MLKTTVIDITPICLIPSSLRDIFNKFIQFFEKKMLYFSFGYLWDLKRNLNNFFQVIISRAFLNFFQSIYDYILIKG